jgi:hypothetical protein
LCDPKKCYDKAGNDIMCKKTTPTKGESGLDITTSGGALQDKGTTNSNNNTTPLRLNVTLNATSSTNPNAVLKDGGHFKDGGLSTGSNNTANSTAMKAGFVHSPTGYCSVVSRTTCMACDPGLPEGRYNCIPEEDWPENALPTFKN